MLKSAQHFLVPDFSFKLCKSYGPAKFTKIATFHPIHAQKLAKIPDMYMGGKQILQAAAIFIDKSVFCCFEHLFESQDDSF
jgi:hypothetical protein